MTRPGAPEEAYNNEQRVICVQYPPVLGGRIVTLLAQYSLHLEMHPPLPCPQPSAV